MKFWRKGVILGSIAIVGFIVLCGLGGYSILKSFQDSAKNLEPEFARAKRNGILLTIQELSTERALAPSENAALLYKEVFDEWVKVLPDVPDERWQSFLAGNVGEDEKQEILALFDSAALKMAEASQVPTAQWTNDYTDYAFTHNAMWAPLTEVHQVWIRGGSQHGPPEELWIESLRDRLVTPNHVLESNSPGSLRTAAVMRIEVLNQVSRLFPTFLVNARGNPEKWGRLFEDNLEVLEKIEPIDPLPVWRTTAFLQFATWDNFERLNDDQKALFASARRDDGVMIDAASTEIMKFWNNAIESAKGKSGLEQYLILGDAVLKLRQRTDLVVIPLKQLWTLDSATKGAGSLDWIMANEQLMLTKQALDVLADSKKGLPQTFECKRNSVVGMKPYTYERTATGFKISAKPSDILAQDSALAKQNLVYEFKEVR